MGRAVADKNIRNSLVAGTTVYGPSTTAILLPSSKQQNVAFAQVMLQQLRNSNSSYKIFIFVVIKIIQNELIFLNICDGKNVITWQELF